ncbi:hypothetical protein PIB30_096176, partial [Stylosanthes scabra]|nr:hypothetical protein [Stylosanthes scabra]
RKKKLRYLNQNSRVASPVAATHGSCSRARKNTGASIARVLRDLRARNDGGGNGGDGARRQRWRWRWRKEGRNGRGVLGFSRLRNQFGILNGLVF